MWSVSVKTPNDLPFLVFSTKEGAEMQADIFAANRIEGFLIHPNGKFYNILTGNNDICNSCKKKLGGKSKCSCGQLYYHPKTYTG